MRKYYMIIGVLIVLLAVVIFWPKPTPTLYQTSFEQLPGWYKAPNTRSFKAFKRSCAIFLRQNDDKNVGTNHIPLKAKDWKPACKAALEVAPVTNENVRYFFQTWFKPVVFHQTSIKKGLFTGYYLPLLNGSLKPTKRFHVPIYGLPDNLITTVNLDKFQSTLPKRHLVGRVEHHQFKPFYTREEINKGALLGHAPVLVWVDSYIDRLYLEIQGSGIIRLNDNTNLYVGYAGENGAPYTPIGQVLIQKQVLSKKNTSMQSIRAYLEAHPAEILPVINQNKSFVFFKILKHTAAIGAQGVELTSGYSLAIDRQWVPLGTPLWLDTTYPESKYKQTVLQRLMIAQDTGGAIKGKVRGDVFWGAGPKATYIAGKMQNKGQYWLLIPKHCVIKINNNV
ncbi:MAG: hypothetical protein CMF38_01330 [Legionellaceae bacterium]|nr:hypothetical protein [Legionellaceae bacterium]HAF88137.1 hypothetical protein [Legionellales bacterium]HCA89884.1 hypothetical protein [Legionellales bacterium]|tara:strand:- start:8267 stop:9448 length:1182 start_codon:yes stop_codon:yes gene_type:complete